MTLKSKLKVESTGALVFSIFYAVAGIAQVFILATSNFRLAHIGVLGLLSLITAYGLFRMRRWSVPLVIALFLLGITFGALTLYDSIILQTFEGALPFHLLLIAYLVMTVIALVYVVAKRKNFGEGKKGTS